MQSSDTLLIDATALKKSFGRTVAVDRVSLQVGSGEIVCVIGPNGAGKTTLLQLLGGITLPDSGHATVLGMHRWKQNFEIRTRSIFVPATPIFGTAPTPFEYLRFVAQLYHLPKDDFLARLDKQVQQLRYAAHLHKPWQNLSLGLGKKAAIMAAFLPDLPLRILDEPFAGGIDPLGMEVLYTWMQEAAARNETTLFSTQVLEQAEAAGMLALLNGGQLQEYGTPDELMRKAQVDPTAPRAMSRAFITLTGADL